MSIAQLHTNGGAGVVPEEPPYSLEEYERIRFVGSVPHDFGEVLFETPNRACAWRVQSFFEKEPDTIAWIAGFVPGAVYVDIGANIGLYAIWAARTAGARVWAFEPEAQNFALLNRNILLNKVNVAAFPFALSDQMRVAPIFLSGTEVGGSCHNFGAAKDYNENPMRAVYKQGSIALPLDDLVEGGLLPQPDHIKIDVDGIEPAVVMGALRTIKGCKSVLVEINSNLASHREAVSWITELGFTTDPDQIDRAQRKEGSFKGTGNVIFSR